MKQRAVAVWVAALVATTGGCSVEEEGAEVAVASQPIIGGTVDVNDPAVVLLMGNGACTGTLVAPNVVLTAAHCVPMSQAWFGNSYQDTFAQRSISSCYASRYFVYPGLYSGHDLALCRLTEDAPPEVEPLPMNFEPLDQSFVGAEIRSVGFGNTDGINDTGWGTKRQVSYAIRGIKYETIVAGDEFHNICQGDSGGPTFLNFAGTERIIAVHSFGATGCQGESESSRVDVYRERFVQEIVDAWYGPCKRDSECVTEGCTTPDPDCDICGFDGVCGSGCARKDLDCPVGVFYGGFCDDREDCEDLNCIPAPEDERVHYCSGECDPDRPEDDYGCMPPLSACVDDGTGTYVCRFAGLTPSVQGASCSEAADCRSGNCYQEDGICVEQCGEGMPACGEGYVCTAVDGVEACLLPKPDENCQISRVGRRGGSAGSWLLGLLALALVAVGKKRRIRSSQ